MDRLITAMAAEGTIRVHAAVTTKLVARARDRHDCAPTAAAALGRLLTAAALMGGGLKGGQRVVLQVAGDGPLRNLVAEAFLHDGGIGARGYALHPEIDLPLAHNGKFDIASAVGSGVLQVTRTLESGQPYTGVVQLVSGEIGDDLATYFANSEQTPSVVALGVLASPEGIVAAGGVIAQLLPGASDRAIDTLERAVKALPSVTKLIREGADARGLIQAIAGDLTPKQVRELTVDFVCRCSREKVEVAVRGLGSDMLEKIVHEQKSQRVVCDYCKRVYELTPQELAALLHASQNGFRNSPTIRPLTS